MSRRKGEKEKMDNGRTLTRTEQERIIGMFRKNLSKRKLERYSNEDLIIKELLMIDNEYNISVKNIKDCYAKYNRENIMEFSKTLDRAEYIIDYVKVMSQKVAKNMMKKTNIVGIIYFAYNHLKVNKDNVSDFLYYFFNGDKADRQTDVNERVKAMETAYSVWTE